jgi:hypothetical protein
MAIAVESQPRSQQECPFGNGRLALSKREAARALGVRVDANACTALERPKCSCISRARETPGRITMGSYSRSRYAGIQVWHRTSCASEQGKYCNRKPSYRADMEGRVSRGGRGDLARGRSGCACCPVFPGHARARLSLSTAVSG